MSRDRITTEEQLRLARDRLAEAKTAWVAAWDDYDKEAKAWAALKAARVGWRATKCVALHAGIGSKE